ncbi:MAG: hypothetical protein ACYDAG_12845, partial [Chloroflexota bacterium]
RRRFVARETVQSMLAESPLDSGFPADLASAFDDELGLHRAGAGIVRPVPIMGTYDVAAERPRSSAATCRPSRAA